MIKIAQGPGGHTPDGSGPPEYGRKQGPGKGRQDGSGLNDPSPNEPKRQVEGIERIIEGPAGHIPDGSGPPAHGRGQGPGRGLGDGTGLKQVRELVTAEYAPVYTKYDISESDIIQYHNEAIRHGYSGEQRREYVGKQVAKHHKLKARSDTSDSETSDADGKSDKNAAKPDAGTESDNKGDGSDSQEGDSDSGEAESEGK